MGILWDDGLVYPTAPIQRAIQTAVAKLKSSSDIKVVDFKAFESAENYRIIVCRVSWQYFAVDMCRVISTGRTGESASVGTLKTGKSQ